MRTLLALVLSCAVALPATQGTARADVCPGGQCPVLQHWPAPPSPPRGLELDPRPIARIVNALGTAQAMGSGTLIDATDERGWVLTCAHLFRTGTGTITVTFPGGEAFAARLLRIDEDADLAALVIRAPATRPVELASEFPQRGDPLVSCGYGSDGRLGCNYGRALGYVTTLGSHGRETLELSGAARMGDSGGPVLDRNGHLVAVLFGTDGRVVDGTFCGRIRRFLRGLSPRFCQPRPVAPPKQEPPAQAEPAGPLVEVPRRVQPPVVAPERPPAQSNPRPPEVEFPTGADPIGSQASPLQELAQPWLAEKLTALLISLGVPGGIAGAAGGAIVWLFMRRGKQKLQAELDRLKARLGELPVGVVDTSFVERHHNRYVPYEASTLDKAWAAAHARVGERYPGAVPYLKIVEGVKDQLLSGNEEPIVS